MNDTFGIRADETDRDEIARLNDELREIGQEDSARYAATLARRQRAVKSLARRRQYR